MSSTLGALSERVNKEYLDLSFNYKYDKPSDPAASSSAATTTTTRRRASRSSSTSTASTRTTTAPRTRSRAIDFSKMERVTRTIYSTAHALAELPTRPAVDRQLPAQLTTEP